MGLTACIVATMALVLSMVAINDCHYLQSNYVYCHPALEAKSPFGSCGDCHCINLDKPCPTNPEEIPLTDMSDDWLRQLKR